MIVFKQKGDFKRTKRYLNNAEKAMKYDTLDQYGQAGVKALTDATPRDTGLTAQSWSYKIERTKDKAKLSFYNSNIQNGVKVAIILQYGHATKNGTWIEGIDYINPALTPVFENLAQCAWEEVTKV